MGNGGVEVRGSFGFEGISIITERVGGDDAAGIIGGLGLRRIGVARDAGLENRGGIRHELSLSLGNISADETRGSRARRDDAVFIERYAFGIGDGVAGRDGAILGDGGGLNLDYDAGTNVVSGG